MKKISNLIRISAVLISVLFYHSSYAIPTTCTGTPNPGTVHSLTNSSGSAFTAALYLSGATSGTGITYQWASSTDNATFTNVTGATNATYTAYVTGIVYYECTLTCTQTGGGSATTPSYFLHIRPAAISGSSSVCNGASITLSDAITGGTWVSRNTSIATVNGSGLVTGASAGTVAIAYYIGSDTVSKSVTVNPLPDAGTITGPSSVCVGSNITLTDLATGGAWLLSNGNASISGGVLTGLSAGDVIVGYAVTNGCGTTNASTVITINPLANAGSISGSPIVCVGAHVTLNDAAGGGVWSCSNSNATVSSGGVVTGVTTGSATISYTVTNGCSTDIATAAMTINTVPCAGLVEGNTLICGIGSSTSLSGTVSGGVWSSGDNSVATVDASGNVTGVSAGNVTISYAVTNGCGTTYATAYVTVMLYPDAGTISGASSVCLGASIVLSDGVSGGVWSSASSNVYISGVYIIGMAAGNATITYTVNNSCGSASTTSDITVNPLPDAGTITEAGTGHSMVGYSSTVCVGATVSLTDASTGGTWSSSDNSTASVDGSGVVSGIVAGYATIYYTVTTDCGTAVATRIVAVNPLPDAGTITGASSMCNGTSIVLSDLASGGSWSSSFGIVAGVDNFGTVSAFSAGNATISYTVTNSCGTANAAMDLTVNPLPYAGRLASSWDVCAGASTFIPGASLGGVWSCSDYGVATVGTSGLVIGIVSGTANISYSVTNSCGTDVSYSVLTVNPLPVMPPAINGTFNLCSGNTTTLNDATTGGTWSSSNATIASIDASTGLVTANAAGTATISYTVSNACGNASNYSSFTVNANPAGISGLTAGCVGSIVTVHDVTTGGVWSSSNTGVATVGSSNGFVSGLSAGVTTISYILGSGCYSTYSETINVSPSAISGPTSVCNGRSITLSNSTSGGTWVSSNATIAYANSSTGVITGGITGTTTISYVIPGCVSATVTMSANPNPTAILGSSSLCTIASLTLSDATPNGVWSSNNTAIASIDATSGVITGVSAGTASISYTLPATGCFYAANESVAGPQAISGPSTMCAGTIVTFSDAVTSGSWSSSNSSLISISSSTGLAFASSSSFGVTTLSYSKTGCTVTQVVSVNPVPAAISGSTTMCTGNINALNCTTTGGIWSSSNTSAATVVPSTGIVSGIAAGSTTISYTLGTGCYSTINENVNAISSVTSGPSSVCKGKTISLSNSLIGGVWTSGNSSIAAVNSATGVVNGANAGMATISYTTTGCGTVIYPVTVNPNPSAFMGVSSVCTFASTTLSDTTSGGIWSSGNTDIATIGSVNGVITGVSAGTAAISYTLPATGCYYTFNEYVGGSQAISGPSSICQGSSATFSDAATSGTWMSSNPALMSINSTTGLAFASSPSFSVVTVSYVRTGCTVTQVVSINPLPAAITGSSSVCGGNATTLSSISAGGNWSSNNTGIATVGSATGIVTGLSAGSTTISYTLPTGCSRTLLETVGSAITANTGATNLCVGATLTLSNATPGGTWSSSNMSMATVSTTGVVTGAGAGSPVISYTIFGCAATTVVTIEPAVISGAGAICVGNSVIFSDASPGGNWISGNTAIATIASTSGTVTGVGGGVVSITYTTTAGCTAVKNLTVGQLPVAISGGNSVCSGNTITFSDATPTGIWSSMNTGIATVDATTGVITGVGIGTAVIKYTLVYCPVSKNVTVTSCRESNFTETADGVYQYSLFPNPTSGMLHIVQSVVNDGFANVRVLNYTGQTVYAGQVEFRGGTTQLNMGGIASGIYLIGIIDPTGATSNFRVVVE